MTYHHRFVIRHGSGVGMTFQVSALLIHCLESLKMTPQQDWPHFTTGDTSLSRITTQDLLAPAWSTAYLQDPFFCGISNSPQRTSALYYTRPSSLLGLFLSTALLQSLSDPKILLRLAVDLLSATSSTSNMDWNSIKAALNPFKRCNSIKAGLNPFTSM